MSTGRTPCPESAQRQSLLEPWKPRDRRRAGCSWSWGDGRHRRRSLLWRLRGRRRLTGGTRLLQRLEVDEGQIVRQHGADLVRLGLREIALRLNHEEARR